MARAHPGIRAHRALRGMSRCPNQVVSLKLKPFPDEPKSCALETTEHRYRVNVSTCLCGQFIPPETNVAGTGWFCQLFEESLAVEKNAPNYDGEVSAVSAATTQLLTTGQLLKKLSSSTTPKCNFSLKQ
ncbi:hypothetical protein TNCV_2062771 [Trichonephila clavipes]|nr:hypothetical protein TNCV_2062771 [Trichonephila clavipes]